MRAVGLVEGGASGGELLRGAVEVLAGSPARLEHARALIDLGAALRRANNRTEARTYLREGIDLAHPSFRWSHGLTGMRQRVRALDHGIEALARRPVAKLDPPVRAALRTGAY